MKKTVIAKSAVINNSEIISPAVITIENGIITDISQSIPSKTENTIDLGDMTLLPGFTNAHCHLELTNIGPLNEKRYAPWIYELMDNKMKLTPLDLAEAIIEGTKSLNKSGVTSILDHISFDNPIDIYKKIETTVIGFGEVLGSIPEVSQKIYTTLKSLKKASPIPFHISPHAVQTVAEDILKDVFNNESSPFSIHLAEYKGEQEYFVHNSGDFFAYVTDRYPELKGLNRHQAPSAIQYLDKMGYKLDNSLLIHANYVDATDLSIIESWKNVCVVHCPGSFEFFGHDDFPFAEYKKKNIPIALGTDGITSNTTLNYLHEIQLFLNKYPEIDFFELLPLITTNALESIGIKNDGMIKKGYQANMIGFKGDIDIISPIKFIQSRLKIDFLMLIGKIVSI